MATASDLRAARQKAGLTQHHLAKRLGTSGSAVTNVERGHQKASQKWLARAIAACIPLTEFERTKCAASKCFEPSDGFFFCAEHRREVAEATAKAYRRRTASGVCHRCPNPAAPGRVHCQIHLDEAALGNALLLRETPCRACGIIGHLLREHKEMGLCAQCPKKRVGDTRMDRYCAEHQKIYKARYASYEKDRVVKAIASGVCFRCKVRPIALRSKSRCDECLAYALADEKRRGGGTMKRWVIKDQVGRYWREWLSFKGGRWVRDAHGWISEREEAAVFFSYDLAMKARDEFQPEWGMVVEIEWP